MAANVEEVSQLLRVEMPERAEVKAPRIKMQPSARGEEDYLRGLFQCVCLTAPTLISDIPFVAMRSLKTTFSIPLDTYSSCLSSKFYDTQVHHILTYFLKRFLALISL